MILTAPGASLITMSSQRRASISQLLSRYENMEVFHIKPVDDLKPRFRRSYSESDLKLTKLPSDLPSTNHPENTAPDEGDESGNGVPIVDLKPIGSVTKPRFRRSYSENDLKLTKSPFDLPATNPEDTAPKEADEPGNGVPLTEFTVFPKLPAEMRLKVWKMAEPGPRVVKIVIAGWDSRDRPIYRNVTKPPGPLLACPESRYEYLKRYTQLIAGHPKRLSSRNSLSPGAIYFDTTTDTFEFPYLAMIPWQCDMITTFNPRLMWANLPGFSRQKIKHLRFDVSHFRDMQELFRKHLRCADVFKNVETMTLVMGRHLHRTLWTWCLESSNLACPRKWGLHYEWKRVIRDENGEITAVTNELPWDIEVRNGTSAPSAAEPALRTPVTWTEEKRLVSALRSFPPNGVDMTTLLCHLAVELYNNTKPSPADIKLIDDNLSSNGLGKYFTCSPDDGLYRLKKRDMKLILEWS